MSLSDATHLFCTRHRIAFHADLDPVCPQCTLGRIEPAPALEFDPRWQRPLDDSGNVLNARTLKVDTEHPANKRAAP